jgi:hypothetical protein
MKVAALVQAQVFGELAATLPYPIALHWIRRRAVSGDSTVVSGVRA